MNCLQNSEEYNHELKYIITLDGGTTNTRAYLWKQDGSFVSSKKERAGVRNTAMDGSDQVIRETVKRCIDSLIEESHIEESQVQGIFCSGMLTSNVGLEEIPYLCAPVDERALCNAIECRFFNDITRIPFYMIPGVRNHVENIGIDTLEQMDVMRGEETEAVALLRERGKGEDLIFVLPGSHTKIIYANEKGFICRCKTTMSGELLDALFFHTLLKDSLPDFFVGEEEYDYQAVSDGARTAQKNSFTSAAFKTRIYQKYVHKNKKKAANFLLGVLMYYDCLSICEFKKTEALEEVQFVIAGKRIIAQAVYDILTDIMQEKKVHLLDEDELMAAKGAFRLAELYYKWKEGE